MAIEQKGQREAERVVPSGLVCPKDPKRNSTDPQDPPTHLSAEVVEITTPDEKKHPTAKRARIRCNTCQHEWVIDWPIRR